MSTTRRVVPVETWKDPRQRLGVWGEQVALGYLTAKGWMLEAHRLRWGRHEIDLVVRQGDLVAFVEVKTRRTLGCGSGLEAVDRRKQRIVGRVAAWWALRQGRQGDRYRFDVIAVRPSKGGGHEIEHIEDAWRVGSSRVDLQACKLEYSIVSPK